MKRHRAFKRFLAMALVAVVALKFAEVTFGQASRHLPPSPRPAVRTRAVMSTTSTSEVSSSLEVGDSELLLVAKRFINNQSGFYSPPDPSLFAEDFVFRGPYVGPLNKVDYLGVMDTFKIYEALPDISPNAFGFSADPQNSNRVWFLVRNTGSFTGESGIGLGLGLSFPSNGAELRGCPETFSVLFNNEKQVKMLTVGYVSDRFEGNTEGKGAAFGIFNAVGIPFPEPGPFLRFVQWFVTEIIKSPAKSYSLKEDFPKWWPHDEMGSEGYS